MFPPLFCLLCLSDSLPDFCGSVCLLLCLIAQQLFAVHIYLCDDAPKDHKEDFKGESFLAVTLRQQLAEQLYKIHGIPVIRVDRDKGKNESNPKSANLNSCLKKIYGENATPPEMEVVAVFDADQAAHSNFFTSTLPWMDAGDDVAVVQSPQVCSSFLRAVYPTADIEQKCHVCLTELLG